MCNGNKREKKKGQASVFNPLEVNWVEKREDTSGNREPIESVYTITRFHASNTHTNTHTHFYNTHPHSLGSGGHIPPPQSASGFHTLVQGCGCDCGFCVFLPACLPACLCVRGTEFGIF